MIIDDYQHFSLCRRVQEYKGHNLEIQVQQIYIVPQILYNWDLLSNH